MSLQIPDVSLIRQSGIDQYLTLAPVLLSVYKKSHGCSYRRGR